jgi:RimJ/RimL family protein N-acetyltransferase
VSLWLATADAREWVGGQVMLEHALDDVNGSLPLIAINSDGVPVALVTSEDDVEDTQQVAVVVAPEHRGRGYAVAAVRALTSYPDVAGQSFEAEIHQDNDRSVATFQRVGFVEVEADEHGYLTFRLDAR